MLVTQTANEIFSKLFILSLYNIQSSENRNKPVIFGIIVD